jgi:hypothetical protein
MNEPAQLIISGESYPIAAIEPGQDRGLLLLTLGRLPKITSTSAVMMLCQGPNREPVRLSTIPDGVETPNKTFTLPVVSAFSLGLG